MNLCRECADFFLVEGRKKGERRRELGRRVEERRDLFLVKGRKEGRKVKEEGS